MPYKLIATAKHFNRVLARMCPCIPNLMQKQLQRFISITTIQLVITAYLSVFGQQVMAHPADQELWMPYGNGNTGTQQGTHPGFTVAKIKITWLQKNFEDRIRRLNHGLTMGSGKWRA